MNKVVFTNGCFDLIHPGHIELLKKAKSFGSKLVVGINSDISVKNIKGKHKPYQNEEARADILRALRFVDEVIIFNDPTPENIIKELKPDVLVKGGDWDLKEIIGADFVIANGGEVFSIPLTGNFSSTAIAEKIINSGNTHSRSNTIKSVKHDLIRRSITDHIKLSRLILDQEVSSIELCADLILETFRQGNKLLICGNGGSAADAQHIAAEFVGRFETERNALPAIALTTDTSALTAVGNDYGFERIFTRQITALARKDDLLIAISTSGNSPNIISAVMEARKCGSKVLGMTGKKGKKLASLCDACLMIPDERTARIQEAHIMIAHIWCEIIDNKLSSTD